MTHMDNTPRCGTQGGCLCVFAMFCTVSKLLQIHGELFSIALPRCHIGMVSTEGKAICEDVVAHTVRYICDM